MGKLVALLTTVALLGAGTALGWSLHRVLGERSETRSEEAGGKQPESRPSTAVAVTTAPIRRGTLPIVESLMGRIEADTSALVTISARAGGVVVAVHVQKGQLVAAGEVLARFDAGPLRLALLQAKSAHAAAAAQLAEFERVGRERTTRELDAARRKAAGEVALAQAQLERLAPLRADGLVAEKTLADARFAVTKAELDRDQTANAATSWVERGGELQLATLNAAEQAAAAAVHEAERAVTDVEVRAPRAGRLLAWSVHEGDRQEPLAALGTLLCGDRRVITFGAPAEAVARIALGAPATWDDANGEVRSAKVVRIAGQVAQDGLVDVGVEVPGEGVPPLPGTIVKGAIETGHTPEAVLVPNEALVRRGEVLAVVLVSPDGTAKTVEVKVLGRSPSVTAITGDLGAATKVVTSGGYNLPDGTHLYEVATGETKR